jgi:hypothetical protein
MFTKHTSRWRLFAAAAMSLSAVAVVGASVGGAVLAKGGGACDNGGFRVINPATGASITVGKSGTTVPASAFGSSPTIAVRGRYNQFDVRLGDFATLDWAFTGVANPKDITGGLFTPVFASKVPDLRGATLTSAVTISIDKEKVELGRSGSGVSMKIQGSDCAQGGVFQMEPERSDGTRTRIVHTLAQSATPQSPFYFDNPNFRAHVGEFLGSTCTSVTTGPPGELCVKVATRTNIANGLSADFVGRDSPQVATRVVQPDCNTAAPLSPALGHCGAVSVWDVASGGRMGFVTGEDGTEVANPSTACVQDCQAQDQVRGRLANLGFPFPVPDANRLVPLVSALPLPPLTAP